VDWVHRGKDIREAPDMVQRIQMAAAVAAEVPEVLVVWAVELIMVQVA